MPKRCLVVDEFAAGAALEHFALALEQASPRSGGRRANSSPTAARRRRSCRPGRNPCRSAGVRRGVVRKWSWRRTQWFIGDSLARFAACGMRRADAPDESHVRSVRASAAANRRAGARRGTRSRRFSSRIVRGTVPQHRHVLGARQFEFVVDRGRFEVLVLPAVAFARRQRIARVQQDRGDHTGNRAGQVVFETDVLVAAAAR